MRLFFPLLLAGAIAATPLSAQEAQEARPVFSEVVTPSAANFRSFPGIVRATREVNLAFLAGGTIDTRPVSLGDAVEGDAVIATLDERSLRDDAVAARASLRAAEAQAAQAKQAYQRVEELNRRGVASTSNLESAKAAMETTTAAAPRSRAPRMPSAMQRCGRRPPASSPRSMPSPALPSPPASRSSRSRPTKAARR
ncbi:hypothetical protein [Aminobacter sp. J44]|uniref:hypothetical protein n=1 Tax=Aminobacter sp. J44 TaxID=935262 RepID=UPI00119A13E4|nr:hypothetical protein [Aminobacter sp. J44]TWG52923.1 hypothetical protein L610_005800000040 [Aminobacter sp. J44]